MSKLLIISGDSDGRVHVREWSLGRNLTKKVLAEVDWDEEFEKMLAHYEANGHPVKRQYGMFDERIIHIIRVEGPIEFLISDG